MDRRSAGEQRVAPRSFRNALAFRAWLEKNHAKARELVVRLQRVHAADRGVTYAEALDEALCYGWIDGVRRPIDGDSFSVRFSPRKARSTWSLVNMRHVKRLIAEGRMAPAGLAAFEARDEKRTGVYSFEQRTTNLPAPYKKAFRANGPAWDDFQSRPPWYQRTSAHWVMSAKKEETRGKRLATLIDCSARGVAIPPLDRTSPSSVGARRETKSGGRMADHAKARTKAKVETIDEYLVALDQDKRAALERLRQIIRSAVPKAEECISYQLPAFRLGGRMLVWFGAGANHCAFYPGAVVQAHEHELKGFETSKGTIRFKPEHPLPAALVRKLLKARIARIHPATPARRPSPGKRRATPGRAS
ncbi:MAG: DUF1801 domain-containing protein [Bacteroidales bacterium]